MSWKGREKQHHSPIHRYSGLCPALRFSKNSGCFPFISATHFLLFSKMRSWLCWRYLRTSCGSCLSKSRSDILLARVEDGRAASMLSPDLALFGVNRSCTRAGCVYMRGRGEDVAAKPEIEEKEQVETTTAATATRGATNTPPARHKTRRPWWGETRAPNPNCSIARPSLYQAIVEVGQLERS